MSSVLKSPLSIQAPKQPVQNQQDDGYEIGDPRSLRRSIYDKVLGAAQGIQPLANSRHTLRLSNVRYQGPESFPIPEQKAAIIEGRSLARRLRGTWELMDNATGNVLDKTETTIAHVPYLSDRGTFIHNGVEYILANQMRLRPGVFSRVKENGELEAHVNILPGKGPSHRYFLDPAKGIFKAHIQQADVPLLPILRALGATDSQLKEAWGDELWAMNMKNDNPAALAKAFSKFVRRGDPRSTEENKRLALAKAFQEMEMDPEVNRKTLGKDFKNLSLEAILETTKKLIKLSRGDKDVDVDDRDHLAFQQIVGPDDLLAERIAKDYGGLRRNMLRRASFAGSLKHTQPGMLTPQLVAAFLSSGLGQNPEEINPLDIFDKQSKITRMGEGGIGSLDSVPDESRSVQPSHMGFIDPVRTPESARAGVDSFLARTTRRGKDGRIYVPFKDARTGQTVHRSPQDVADLTIGIPSQLGKGYAKRVAVMRGGKLTYAPRNEVDLWLPNFENAFSPLGAMVPMKSAVKAQRMAMASRMFTQALPLVNPEAPLVQSGAMPDDPLVDRNRSYEEIYGEKMGAVRAKKSGKVVSVDRNQMVVQYDDGKTETHELYDNWPYNRKTLLNSFPLVTAGQRFDEDQPLVRSNYTDKNGAAALGLNLRTGYIALHGHNFEDAVVISESAAKKLTSEHMYQHNMDVVPEHKISKADFVSLFPGTYNRKQLDLLDDHGVAKPGAEVHFGDPLVLASKQRELTKGRVHRKRAADYSDDSITWEHHTPGIVTDVFRSKKGVSVLVKTEAPMQIGDKLCYADDTEVLTSNGWINVAEVTKKHLVASLREDGVLEYIKPAALHRYAHSGRMYALQTTQVDLLVTDNHKLYAKPRGGDDYSLIEAQQLYGKRYRLKSDAVWHGVDPEYVVFPELEVSAGQSGAGSRMLPAIKMPVKTYAMLLGLFLSEGNVFDHADSGSFGIDICQVKPASKKVIEDALIAAGVRFNPNNDKFRIYGKQLWEHFRALGRSCHDKYIPENVFGWTVDSLQELYRWLMLGDGSTVGTGHSYFSTSKRLADDVQRLCLHIGLAAKVEVSHEAGPQVIRGVTYNCKECYAVHIYRKKTRPEINHGHVNSQNGQSEQWVDYDGDVYCVTLPRNHVLYVRRNGKPVWCGNSGRYGDKGVVSAILPDSRMPHDATGMPIEIAVNPLGIISRTNPAQVAEAVLGKIAEKQGKPYKYRDFQEVRDLTERVIDEARKNNVKDTEDLIDPDTGKTIKNILTGKRFFMKLSHTSESKAQGRGIGGYTSDDTPAKGGPSGSKQLGLLEMNAVLSHGALGVIQDAAAVRGQKHDEFWLPFLQGLPTPKPKVPMIYHKFINQLRSAGINVVEDGPRTHIMALTDKDVDTLAGDRYIDRGDTVNFDDRMSPIPGGLFDESMTGGHGGNRWAAIKLAVPLPNPVMEEPIRRLLGLTREKFDAVIAGTHPLDKYGTGPQAISKALDAINVDKELEQTRAAISSGKRTLRDAAIRKLGYLKSAQRLGIHPRDWVLSKVPVLPPNFRPVSVMQGSGLPMIADPNYLYKELIEANNNLKELASEVDDVGSEQAALYNSFRAVVGLGDPVHPKLREKRVSGVLKHIFASSPKQSMPQRKLMSSAVDIVGRAVVTPDPNLDMDTVGLPENKAWEVYKNFVRRRLRRHGMSMIRALQEVEERTPLAREMLMQEMSERPVLVNRAPSLHRFNIMAAFPKLVKDDTLHVSPLIVKGFTMDFDGDAVQYHVPVLDKAVREAIDMMLPSRNLLSPADFARPVHQPSQEYTGGLYAATTAKNDKRHARVFRSLKDALASYRRGELDLDDLVEVLT